MVHIAEKDWKYLRSIKQQDIYHHFCDDIFNKIEAISSNRSNEAHKSYLELWSLLQEEDEKIADMFNDLERSNAIFKIVSMAANNLIAKEHLSNFTDETRSRVESIPEIRRS